MGNLFAAMGNVTGAIFHYQESLRQDPLHKAAFTSLRIMHCYQKFHRNAQSSVPREDQHEPCASNADAKVTCTSFDSEKNYICIKVWQFFLFV